jgi:hypothetical protein
MPGPKLNNNRKYPDATRQPCHLDRLRKEGAKERQAEYEKLTLQEKLARLPVPGANKQRARLEALVAKELVAKQATEAKATAEKQKKLAKKDGK